MLGRVTVSTASSKLIQQGQQQGTTTTQKREALRRFLRGALFSGGWSMIIRGGITFFSFVCTRLLYPLFRAQTHSAHCHYACVRAKNKDTENYRHTTPTPPYGQVASRRSQPCGVLGSCFGIFLSRRRRHYEGSVFGSHRRRCLLVGLSAATFGRGICSGEICSNSIPSGGPTTGDKQLAVRQEKRNYFRHCDKAPYNPRRIAGYYISREGP